MQQLKQLAKVVWKSGAWFTLVPMLGLAGVLIFTDPPTNAAPSPVPLVCAPTGQASPLAAEVAKAVEASAPRISAARNKVFQSMITQIATDVLPDMESRRYWVALIGVESRYEGTARSSQGAVGLGQLIPTYKADFGSDCGLTDVSNADLSDDYMNAYLSACYFRALIKANSGNIPLAMVAYNSGAYSKSFASAKAGGSPNAESAAYVSKIVIKKTKIEGKGK